jgi:hypothetical protein
MVGSFKLASNPLPAPSAEQVVEVLKETIQSMGGVNASLLHPLVTDKRQQLDELCNRVPLAAKLSGDDAVTWPSCFSTFDAQASGLARDCDNAVLEEVVEPWLAAAGSLKKVDMHSILLGSLTPDLQRQLDAQYPLKIDAPDDSYSYAIDPPAASAKLQQFFGTVESPAVGPLSNRLAASLLVALGPIWQSTSTDGRFSILLEGNLSLGSHRKEGSLCQTSLSGRSLDSHRNTAQVLVMVHVTRIQ